MFTEKIWLIVLLLVVILASGCEQGSLEPEALVAGVATSPEPAVGARAPELGPVVPSGKLEVRDLSPTVHTVPNCSGVASPVKNNPSMSVGSTHTVEWSVGGSTGIGVTIGEGVLPGGVNLEAALEGHVENDLSNAIQQTSAWELPADPGTIMEYTIMWHEVWQPGYLDVTFMDPEPKIVRIDVKYRTGIESEIVGDRLTPCDPGAQAPETADETIPQPPAPIDAPAESAQPFCPFLTSGQVEQLREAASVPDAIRQAEEFAGHQQSDYQKGATIPASVVIATDLQNSDLSAFPVSPIRNQGGWGLFVTMDAFVAPNAGTYWCVQ